jgi:hypothetical protein
MHLIYDSEIQSNLDTNVLKYVRELLAVRSESFGLRVVQLPENTGKKCVWKGLRSKRRRFSCIFR